MIASALESGLDWGTKLNNDDTFVFYHFYGYGETTPFGEVSSGFTDYEKGQFKKALAVYSSFLNLHFHEVSQAGQADYNLLTFAESGSTLGAMYPPGETDRAGFGYFNYAGSGWDWSNPGSGGLEQGGFGFVTIIHELGHGLGLAHPHDKGGHSTIFPGVSSAFDDLGDYDLNQGVYTTMSYNTGWQTNPDGLPPSLSYGYQGTPMALDIAVLQEKYGANNAYHTGNDTYFLPSSNGTGTFYSCIWDAGGTDRIVYGGSDPALIDLREATLKLEPGGGGFLSYADGIYGGFTIAHGVTIENAIGGTGADYLQGNTARNLIKGRAGDDEAFGGRGRDKLIGGSGGDSLTGDQGRDILDGKSGADDLTGGAGRDRFMFTSNFAPDNIDTINDFATGKDKFVLSKHAFKGIGPKGKLDADAFVVGSSAKDGSDRIVYDKDSGAVGFDRDGDGGNTIKQFAVVEAGLDLKYSDFVVVA
ncbi:MAG: M10 family metallopeptidase [Bauldia sp.]|nr:M10 family metallopeptidase [Bauldia sp.]